jgi:hypothetical protein
VKRSAREPPRRPWVPRALGGGRESLGLTLREAGGTLLETDLRWAPCWRIIGSERAGENLFDRLGADADAAEALRDLADLTNPVMAGALEVYRGIPRADRFFGPNQGLVTAAFCILGTRTRFSDGSFGVLYASGDEATATAETVYHGERRLLAAGIGSVRLRMTVLSLDIAATAVDLRPPCPAPAGVYDPTDYGAGNRFGGLVRDLGGEAIAYASVRRRHGECATLFRPAGVRRCEPSHSLLYEWGGTRITVRSSGEPPRSPRPARGS